MFLVDILISSFHDILFELFFKRAKTHLIENIRIKILFVKGVKAKNIIKRFTLKHKDWLQQSQD
jgi:hypothetical protein